MTAVVNFLILGTLVGNVLLALFRPRQGVALYVLFALVLPHFHLGGAAISYEILAFLPVGLVVFYRREFRVYPKMEYGLWISYFVLAIAATLFSVVRFGAEVRWLSVFGWGRALFLFLLVSSFLDRKYIFRVLLTAIIINTISAVAQLFVPGALEVTYNLYAKESQTVLAEYIEKGIIPRATGTVGSPVNLGAISLLTFSLSFDRILRIGYNASHIIAAVSAIAAGLFAFSKSVILGVPLIILLGMVFRIVQKFRRGLTVSPRRLLGAIGFAVTSGLGGWYVISLLRASSYNILRYLAFLFKPLEAFETRYGETDETTLNKTLEVTGENWLTGLGFTAPFGEFLGDSAYVLALHTAGVWGIIVMLLTYVVVSVRGLQRDGATILLPLAALGMTGFGLPTFFYLFGVVIISYVLVREQKV